MIFFHITSKDSLLVSESKIWIRYFINWEIKTSRSYSIMSVKTMNAGELSLNIMDTLAQDIRLYAKRT